MSDEQTLTDTIYNGDELARQMHDPATLDSAQSTIEAQLRARIAELERDLADALKVSAEKGKLLDEAIAENEQLRTDVARLRKENNALVSVCAHFDALNQSVEYLRRMKEKYDDTQD